MELWIHMTNLNDIEESLSEVFQKMKSKFQKYWDNFNDLLSIACILDPRFKLERFTIMLNNLYPSSSEFVEAKTQAALTL